MKFKIDARNIKSAIATLLILLIAGSTLLSSALADTTFAPGTEIPTYAFISVAPNPIGVGQTVNVNFFLATSIQSGEAVTNMTVKITDPDGNVETRGPITGDTTGGSYFNFVPDQVGNWTFQFFYGGQTTLRNALLGDGFVGLKEMPSQSEVVTLTVQEEPITQTAYPITPLPTEYWEAPVSAQNVQEWYKYMGPWGLGGSVGYYNATSLCNPYTASVLSGHVIWTKVWCTGGVVGGEAGGDEESGHYWSTRQYTPQFAPVIIADKMYSTWYPESYGCPSGIICTDLATGETLYTINTTSILATGMANEWKTVNAYGVVGPYVITTGALPAAETGGIVYKNFGTQYNLYSALSGKYVCSICNASSMTLTTDATGNLIGYYINRTIGQVRTYQQTPMIPMVGFQIPQVKEVINITTPALCCFNLSKALVNDWLWYPTTNNAIDAGYGLMWAKPIPLTVNDVTITPTLSVSRLCSNTVILTSGLIHASDQSTGYLVMASMDAADGTTLWSKNLTYPDCKSLLPFTRASIIVDDGIVSITNHVNWISTGIDCRTGAKAWETALKTPYGNGEPSTYSMLGGTAGYSGANGKIIIAGLGGDIWAIETKTGKQLWYTNTTTLIGDPGIESPYGMWPLWTFRCQAYTNDVAYLPIGHEYNPPLFHGAQMLAINLTDGTLIWKELGTYVVATAIAYNTLISLNCYDNQIYAFAKGPSKLTVDVPDVGVTTATPITITGTVTDISAGTTQSEVAKKFPNGLACVSEESQSKWMEYAYQDQPRPSDATGVTVTLSVVDSNNNYREIGTTTSNSYGSYGFTWTPDIAGDYTIIATFGGSNSYYPSSAVTYFHASEAATPAPTTQPLQAVDNTMTILGSAVAVIIAISIVGAVILMSVKKRP